MSSGTDCSITFTFCGDNEKKIDTTINVAARILARKRLEIIPSESEDEEEKTYTLSPDKDGNKKHSVKNENDNVFSDSELEKKTPVKCRLHNCTVANGCIVSSSSFDCWLCIR